MSLFSFFFGPAEPEPPVLPEGAIWEKDVPALPPGAIWEKDVPALPPGAVFVNDVTAGLLPKIKAFNAGIIDEHLDRHVDRVAAEWLRQIGRADAAEALGRPEERGPAAISPDELDDLRDEYVG